MKKPLAIFLLLVLLCTSCASVAPVASRIPWWKIASYGVMRLSDKLNEKAEEEAQKLKENEAEHGDTGLGK